MAFDSYILYWNGKSLGHTEQFYSTCSGPGCHVVGKAIEYMRWRSTGGLSHTWASTNGMSTVAMRTWLSSTSFLIKSILVNQYPMFHLVTVLTCVGQILFISESDVVFFPWSRYLFKRSGVKQDVLCSIQKTEGRLRDIESF